MQLPNGIFQRANLQFITESLLDEGQQGFYEEKTYEERLSVEKEQLLKKLDNVLTTKQDFLVIESQLNATLSTFEDVFFEIGLKVGVKLHGELLTEN